MGGGIFANLVLQPLSVLGILFPPREPMYFTGLLVVLLTSITIFVRIVFVRPSGGGRVAP